MYVDGLLKVRDSALCSTKSHSDGLTQINRSTIQILKTFSDKPQAKELIRELESFSLTPNQESISSDSGLPFPPLHHSPKLTNPSSTESTTSTTASLVAPPSRIPPTPSAQSHRSHAAPSVAPSLPGYGPPRTSVDPVRSRRTGGGRRRGYSSSDQERDVEKTPGERYGTPVFRPPISPGILAANQFSPYQNASGSEQHQQQFPGMPPPPLISSSQLGLQQQFLQPLNTSTASLRPSPILPPSPHLPTIIQPPNLSITLDQIQTSVQALHERISSIETVSPTATGIGQFFRDLMTILFLRRVTGRGGRARVWWRVLRGVWRVGKEVAVLALLGILVRRGTVAGRTRGRIGEGR